jgi:hypothetical protein
MFVYIFQFSFTEEIELLPIKGLYTSKAGLAPSFSRLRCGPPNTGSSAELSRLRCGIISGSVTLLYLSLASHLYFVLILGLITSEKFSVTRKDFFSSFI